MILFLSHLLKAELQLTEFLPKHKLTDCNLPRAVTIISPSQHTVSRCWYASQRRPHHDKPSIRDSGMDAQQDATLFCTTELQPTSSACRYIPEFTLSALSQAEHIKLGLSAFTCNLPHHSSVLCCIYRFSNSKVLVLQITAVIATINSTAFSTAC